jgi:hypothetical protein
MIDEVPRTSISGHDFADPTKVTATKVGKVAALELCSSQSWTFIWTAAVVAVSSLI